MVAMQQIAHETLATVDVSELRASPEVIVSTIKGWEQPLTIMCGGAPLAQLWDYLSVEIHNFRQDDDGNWEPFVHDRYESEFRHIVELGDFARTFEAIADDLELNGGGALVVSDGVRVAELTPYAPSRLGRSRGSYKFLEEFIEARDGESSAVAEEWIDPP